MKQGIPSDPPSGQQQIGLKETTHRCEVKHKVQTAGSTSRKAQHRAAADAPFPEPVLPADAQPGPRRVDDDGSCSEKGNNPRGAKWARVGVSHRQPSAEHKQRQQAELGHESVPPPQSESARPGPRMMMMMNEHPWKALTLAAYPRPEGSRSNYGAVERILKNYESAARALQNQSLPNQMDSSPDDSSGGQEGNVTVPHMPGIDPLALPPTLRHAQTSNSSQKHSTHAQFSRHSAAGVKEVHLTVQVGSACIHAFTWKHPPCLPAFGISTVQMLTRTGLLIKYVNAVFQVNALCIMCNVIPPAEPSELARLIVSLPPETLSDCP